MKTLVIYVHGKGGNADYVRENPIEWHVPDRDGRRRTLVPHRRTDGIP